MEGLNWARLGGIVLMLLASLYVLLPTFLQEDLESRLARKAGSVEVEATRSVDLDMAFEVRDADPAAAAVALDRRLDAAGVPNDRVTAGDAEVVVQLAPGGDRAVVEQLAAVRGRAELVDPRTVVPPAGGVASAPSPEVSAALSAAGQDPMSWAGALSAAPGAVSSLPGVPAEIAGLTVSPEGRATIVRPALPEGWPFALLVLDGALEGVVVPSGTELQLVSTAETTPAELAILRSGELPALTPKPEVVAPDAAPQAAESADAGGPPAWLVAVLPDTKMNLGLDLQGGLDLTLQVGLEEALLGQASRDMAYLKEQLSKEGVVAESVRRDRSAPILWVTTSAPLADLQTLVRRTLPDYVYAETQEGTRHGFAMQEARQAEVQDQAVEQVLETLRKRVDATGVKEPSIAKKGGGRINIQLPGEVDLQSAVDALGTTAILEFKMVDREFDDQVLAQILQAAAEQMPAEQFANDDLLNDWLWTTGRLPEDRIVQFEYVDTPEGHQRAAEYILKNEAVLTGNDVNDAGVAWDQNQQVYVTLGFKPHGGRVFCDVTTANVGQQFAIVLDQEVQSAPSIRERICGGSARIDMGGADDPLNEAQTLALVLRTGSLDAPVDVGGVRQVGSTLGRDTINSGLLAAGLGGVLVIAFMTLWYRSAGVVASVAVALNVLLLLAGLAMFKATLTLPGIAGIALTVGMAVDANIIIYERIREELKLGVVPRKAVDVGFDKAFEAILDSNITTAIAGVVLFSYGTGPIRGFAVTLLVGIATTLITALYVSRTLMDTLTRSSTARLKI